MTLTSLEEVAARLDQEFGGLEPDISGFRLKPSTLTEDEIVACEQALDRPLPDGFRTAVEQFDLGGLSLGPVHFGGAGRYLSKIVDWNRKADFPWWGSGNPPASMILVAISESYAVLLDTSDGAVYVLPDGEDLRSAHPVASDFLRFLKGVATAFVRRLDENASREIGQQIAEDVGSSSEGTRFWVSLLT